MRTRQYLFLFLLLNIVLNFASCKHDAKPEGMRLTNHSESEKLAQIEVADTVDMGDFYTDNLIKTVSIPIRNCGESKLYLTEALPECDCTQIELQDSVLEPGQASSMRATLDLTGYIAPYTVEKRFAIFCNNKHDRLVHVTLVAHLIR